MSSLFRFPLIKILVMFAVDKRKIHWFDFLLSTSLLPHTKSSSVKIFEEEEVHETHGKKVTHMVKETKIVELKDEKPRNKSTGKLASRVRTLFRKAKRKLKKPRFRWNHLRLPSFRLR